MKKKSLTAIMSLLLGASLIFTACGSSGSAEASSSAASDESTEESSAPTEDGESSEESTDSDRTGQTAGETTLALIDNSKWNYNEEDGVYWQVGIAYCASPASEDYETLGLYVPAAYMDATDNGDGTWTCTVNKETEVAGYTAETAPIVIPVNTPGYSAMSAPTGYSDEVADYTSAGFVYVWAGCRGRDDGAPAGVTDLKAALRYIRYNEGNIAGDMDRIFSFGMSGGGAQSALLGTTGDSDMYTAYLEEIGAVMTTSDAVAGSMCWCPITSLDIADEAYEWNMGVTRTGLSEDEQALSDDLAEAFADYINALGLKDEDGNILTLEESEDGIYQAGSYYDYVKSVVEASLETYIENEGYKTSSSSEQGMPGGGMGGKRDGEKPSDLGDLPDGEMPDGMGELPDGEKPSDLGELPDGEKPSDLGDLPDGQAPDQEGKAFDEEAAQYAADGVNRETNASSDSTGETYDSAEDYIEALNADGEWISYDADSKQVTITSLADFVSACKKASKSLGAFDQLDASQAENTLFGYGDGEGAHFDAILAGLLSENAYGQEYAEAYAEDLARTDALGNTVEYRANMYDPMYYISDHYDGYQSSTVAKYFRIRTGIEQSDTALTTEIDLALALQAYGVDVDFATVWGQGHTQAENEGDSTTNFITWVDQCLAGEA